ncbi:branched-chain amino acid ABC transporter permease [Gottschalkiaceae bacterium SANA]|nr:branched-chain amino acid ABC transporter permease [Gottschalkiaceae bacterium SANA]
MTEKRKRIVINLGLVLSVYVILFVLIKLKVINRYYEGIMIACLINVILATSLNLATGFLGQLALGHAGFMAVGAYTAAIVTKTVGMTGSVQLLFSLLLGGIAAGLMGVVIGIPALRLRGDYLGIITLGFGEIIRVLLFNLNITGGARGLKGIPKLAGFNLVFWVCVLVVFVLYAITNSKQGRAIMSIREDEIAAEAVGIPTVKYKLLGFVMAAFFAGIGGGLFAHYMTVLDPKTFNFMKSVEILVIVVLGGMGSLTGSVVAAIALTILPEALRSFSEYRLLLYSALLIVMMIFKPGGFFGQREFSIQALMKRLKKPVVEGGEE